jgi:hypothetical protein
MRRLGAFSLTGTMWTATVPNLEVAMVSVPDILKRLYLLDVDGKFNSRPQLRSWLRQAM